MTDPIPQLTLTPELSQTPAPQPAPQADLP